MNHTEESAKRLHGWNVERLKNAEFMAEDMIALIDVTLATYEMVKSVTAGTGKIVEGDDADV